MRTAVARRATRAWGPALVAALAALTAADCFHEARAPYAARSAVLRALPLYFYPSRDTTAPPRAVVFFFGNDVGFWEPHQQLAERLASDRVAVIGFDMKALLASLPEGPPARRDSAFADSITTLIAAARAELGAGGVPLIVGGHSVGAEEALWTAAHTRPPGLTGVLAMSPGGRGHLRITLSDRLQGADPTEPGSFSLAETIAAIPPTVRVALIRGQQDKYRVVDSALVAAGGPRLERWVVPLASHSLKKLTLAGPIIARAVNFLLRD